MKKLYILRHAQPAPQDEYPNDADRPLLPIGSQQAQNIGMQMASTGLCPDKILASNALRTRETAEIISKAIGFNERIEQRRDLYDGDENTLLEVVQKQPNNITNLMIVGHIPSTEDFVTKITGKSTSLGKCHLAVVELPVNRWNDTTLNGTAQLIDIMKPNIG